MPELTAADEVVPTDAEREQAATRDTKEQAALAKKRQVERTDALTKLLGASTSSLRLARELQEHRLSDSTRDEVLKMAAVHPDLQVQDLFEQFLPEENRPKKLGAVVRVNELLNLAGDVARGRKLYFETATVQCKSCHRVGEVGSKLGPELTQIGKKPKAQILESILEPSKQVDPKFVTYLVETTDGKVITGLLVERNEKEVILRNAKDELVKIAAADVETVVPQRQSLMPELQLRDMTKEQVADLLEFLSSLK
jgi:putative heme-binding domain-containing protein